MNERFAELEKNQQKPKSIPQWFVDLYGANSEAWEKFQEYDTERQKALKAEIIEEFRTQQVQETQQKAEYQKQLDDWVEKNLVALQEYTVQNKLPAFDKNELIQTMIKYQPSDEDGNLDFGKAYNILMDLKKSQVVEQKEKSDARKKLAADTISKGGTNEREPKDYKTAEDFKGKSLWQIIRGN